MDALVLSHLLFDFTIGLASDLAVLEGVWLTTARGAFLRF